MVFDVDVGRGCADEVPTPTPIEDDDDAKLCKGEKMNAKAGP